jgi:hypothetical protein
VSKLPINVDLELAKTQGRRLQCIVIDAYVLLSRFPRLGSLCSICPSHRGSVRVRARAALLGLDPPCAFPIYQRGISIASTRLPSPRYHHVPARAGSLPHTPPP